MEAAGWRLTGFESFMGEVMAAGPASGPLPPDNLPPQRGAMAPRALPPDTALSQALAYLRRNLRKLKKCANRRCDAPFFVARRLEDQCCSKVCADEVRGRYKKRYWKWKRKGLAAMGKPKPVAKRVKAKSARIQGRQEAIADSVLEEFVLDVVNADKKNIDDGKLYFYVQYPKFFPTWEGDIKAVVALARNSPAMFEKMKQEWPAIYCRGLMRELHEGLRGVWQAEDESVAERLLLELRSICHRQMGISGQPDKSLPPPSSHPIQQALQWVGERLPKLRRCRNDRCPGPLPFFVAAGNQQYCSLACSHEGQKESKLRSWGKHQHQHKWVKKPGKG